MPCPEPEAKGVPSGDQAYTETNDLRFTGRRVEASRISQIGSQSLDKVLEDTVNIEEKITSTIRGAEVQPAHLEEMLNHLCSKYFDLLQVEASLACVHIALLNQCGPTCSQYPTRLNPNIRRWRFSPTLARPRAVCSIQRIFGCTGDPRPNRQGCGEPGGTLGCE